MPRGVLVGGLLGVLEVEAAVGVAQSWAAGQPPVPAMSPVLQQATVGPGFGWVTKKTKGGGGGSSARARGGVPQPGAICQLGVVSVQMDSRKGGRSAMAHSWAGVGMEVLLR